MMIRYSALLQESRFAGEKTIPGAEPLTMVLFLENPHIPTDRTMNTIYVFAGEEKSYVGQLIFDVYLDERKLEIVDKQFGGELAATIPALLWAEQVAKAFGISSIHDSLPTGEVEAGSEQMILYRKLGYEIIPGEPDSTVTRVRKLLR